MTNPVIYDAPQSLSTAEKGQARTNISAKSADAEVHLTDPRWWPGSGPDAALEAARDYIYGLGTGQGTIIFDDGIYNFTTGGIVFNNARARINLKGSSKRSVVCFYSGSSFLFKFEAADAILEYQNPLHPKDPAYPALPYFPATGTVGNIYGDLNTALAYVWDGSAYAEVFGYAAGFNTVSNMSIVNTGGAPSGSRAIVLDFVSFAYFRDLYMEGHELCFDGTDVDHILFDNVTWRFNKAGYYLRQRTSPLSGSTQPNNVHFNNNHWGSCSDYAGRIVGGSNVLIIGGSTEHCGNTVSPAYVHHFQEPGYQGGIGCRVQNHNFEDNSGLADVMCTFTSTDLVRTANFSIVSCAFLRANLAGADSTTNSIRTNFSTLAGKAKLIVRECSFWSTNAYVPSSGRPRIAFAGNTPTDDNFLCDRSNIFADAVEAPAFVFDNPWALIKASASQTILNTTEISVAFDTISESYGWAGTTGSSAFIIPRTGIYSFSFTAHFTYYPAGTKRIRILKNGNIISETSNTGTVDIIPLTQIFECVAGDTISIKVLNNTGVDMILAGPGSLTGMFVKKLA